MRCGLQLHTNGTSMCEKVRENLPFILIPDKRTLFDVSYKSAIPPDFFFNDETTAPHCNVLKKIVEVSSKIDHNSVLQEIRNKFKLIMALRIDEMNVFSRNLFRNQSFFWVLTQRSN